MKSVSQLELIEVRRTHRQAVHAVVAAAFGQTDEADLVERLRDDGAVVLELAAVESDAVVGHILFSRLAVEPSTRTIVALAPLSVTPERQKRGIGSALVREGLTRCAALGFDAVAVLGDVDYYSRFSFRRDAAQALRSAYSGPHYQTLALKPGALSNGVWRVTYPKAFG
jgi:putative acetyltransferase